MEQTEKTIRRIISISALPCALIAPFLLLLGEFAIQVHDGESAALAFECGIGCIFVAWVCWLLEAPS
jgi:hypothetical protein